MLCHNFEYPPEVFEVESLSPPQSQPADRKEHGRSIGVHPLVPASAGEFQMKGLAPPLQPAPLGVQEQLRVQFKGYHNTINLPERFLNFQSCLKIWAPGTELR